VDIHSLLKRLNINEKLFEKDAHGVIMKRNTKFQSGKIEGNQMSYYRDQLEAWLKQIKVDCDSVIDVGGGEQSVKTRVATFSCRRYKILDNDHLFKPDYFADLNYMIDNINEFDILFCLEVFEYIWNPVQAMENLVYFLKPGGIAYISFPTIYPLHNPPGIDYLRYTKNAVEKLLTVAGFKTWEITPRVATTGLSYLSLFYNQESMHPMKNTNMIYDLGYMVKAIK